MHFQEECLIFLVFFSFAGEEEPALHTFSNLILVDNSFYDMLSLDERPLEGMQNDFYFNHREKICLRI